MNIVHTGTNWRYGVPAETVLVEKIAALMEYSQNV